MRLTRFALMAAALVVALGASVIAVSAPARAGVYVGVHVGGPYYGGGYRTYYRGGYAPYYRPGPVVVLPPRAYYPPTVVYASPPVVYAAPPVVYAQTPQVLAPQVDPGTPIYQRADGQYCREYNSTARIEGRNQAVYGTACRQSDGSWQFVN